MSTVLRRAGLGLLLVVRVIVALAGTAAILTMLFIGVVSIFGMMGGWFNPLPPIEGIWSWAIGDGSNRNVQYWSR